jgi:hypothetical protein
MNHQRVSITPIHIHNVLQSTFTLDQRSADCQLHMINILQITITHGQHLVNSSIAQDQRFTINIYTWSTFSRLSSTHYQRSTNHHHLWSTLCKFINYTWSTFQDQLLHLINALQITVTHGQRTSIIMSTNIHRSFINQQHQRSLSLQSTTSTDNT